MHAGFSLCSKGNTTSHCPPHSTPETHHPQYGTTANVTAILTGGAAYVYRLVDVAPTGDARCDIQGPIQLHGL
jgi:hypothetical protein